MLHPPCHARADRTTVGHVLAGPPAAEPPDVAANRAYDRATRLLCRTLGVPLATLAVAVGGRLLFKSVTRVTDPPPTDPPTASPPVPVDDPVCRAVLATAKPLWVDDRSAFGDLFPSPDGGASAAGAFAAVPLVLADGRVVGVLSAEAAGPRAWTADDRDRMADVAALAVAVADTDARLSPARRSPAVSDAPARPAVESKPPPPPAPNADRVPRPRSLVGRVLDVDDRPDVHRQVRGHLRYAGLTVDVVGTGRAAVDLAAGMRRSGSPYDLVVLGRQSPAVDPRVVVGDLRAAGYARPVVALSAAADDAGCLAAGCAAVVVVARPLDAAALVGCVAASLSAAPQVTTPPVRPPTPLPWGDPIGFEPESAGDRLAAACRAGLSAAAGRAVGAAAWLGRLTRRAARDPVPVSVPARLARAFRSPPRRGCHHDPVSRLAEVRGRTG